MLGRYGIDGDVTIDEREKAREAVNQIGVAALPYLLKWIHYEEPATWRTKLGLWAWRTRLPFTTRLANWVMNPTPRQLAAGTYEAFRVLGDRGRPASDELCRALNQTNMPQTSATAAFALAGIGTSSLAPLLTVVSNAQHPARVAAIRAIGSLTNLGDSAQQVVSAITNCLGHSNAMSAQVIAIIALGDLRAAPEISIPALSSMLTNGSPRFRVYSISALGKFGPQASNAIPALTNVLADPDHYVRDSASVALHEIDPATFTSATR